MKMLTKIKNYFKKKQDEKFQKEFKKRIRQIAKEKYEGIINRLTIFVQDDEFHKTGLLLTQKQARKIAVEKFNQVKIEGLLDEMNNFRKVS